MKDGYLFPNGMGGKDATVSSALPTLQLPEGGGSIRGIDEKFQVNAVNGTSSFSLPLPFSTSRMGFAPQIGLGYNSGSGNSAFGLGWSLQVPSITRRTRNYLPTYEDAFDSDIFQLSDTEDLVPLLVESSGNWTCPVQYRTIGGSDYTITPYRPRIEGGFARIERWTVTATGDTHWRVLSANNSCTYYGLTTASRVYDPQDPSRVFEWLLCQGHDDKGNLALLNYKTEDGVGIPSMLCERNKPGKCTQVYLSSVWYGNIQPYVEGDVVPGEDQFLFRAVFDYGEHDPAQPVPGDIYNEVQPWTCRQDPFSSFRSGFDIRTYRRCARVLMFHCFPGGELPQNPCLVNSLDLFYDNDLTLVGSGTQVPGFSFLVKATQKGYIWDPGTGTYSSKSMPDITMTYQQHLWNVEVQEVTPGNRAGAPIGVDNQTYQWVDLFGEGIMGILTEQGNAWYYKSNMGGGAFSAAEALAPLPSYRGLFTDDVVIRELEGNGEKYLVQEKTRPQAFFKLCADDQWQKARFFEAFPTLDLSDRNARFVDLNEDGREEILYTEDDRFLWYEGLGEKGFCLAGTVPKSFDEEQGPAIVFADRDQSIFMADMSGDGLVDIVRIRNGAICYWPNLGYGRFGAKVGMDNAPVFDTSDGFNPSYLRLADVDGSGTTDIVYLGKDDFRVWMNLSGNAWSPVPVVISPFPAANADTTIDILDFLGTGTACIVCSSSFSAEPLRYIDLMGSKKPCLLTGYQNNCGKVVALEYTSSTSFYLADKQAGIPWITKLPFPVQCIASVTTTDLIRESVMTSTMRYRHGFYDPYDKEFRGFAYVEQEDTESFEQYVLNNIGQEIEQDVYQPPVRTCSWFHTGAFLWNRDLVSLASQEYFQNPVFPEYAMPDPLLPQGIDPDDIHEAYRACKGIQLRSEVYSDDGSSLQGLPYATAQSNAQVILLQPKGPNRYASFLVVPSEGISYNYERNPGDPRITHSFVLSSDQYGNITKSAGVIYPRVSRPTGSGAIPDVVWGQQKQVHVTTGETDFTNDVIGPDVYRLRAASEIRAYEIGGLVQPGGFYFTFAPLVTALTGIPTIPYEQNFSGGIQQRLYRHVRTYFAKDDLSGPLPLGQLASLGIVYKEYHLAFTQGLVDQYYGTKVTTAMLAAAMYTHSEGDLDWWTPSGTMVYPASPASGFYTPTGGLDAFGNLTTVACDAYFLLPVSITDALLNTSSSVNDYRVLAPSLITDPNGNQSAVQTDELGMSTALAVMGKPGAPSGDTLSDPTIRMEYSVLNWQNNGQPNYVHVFAREIHGKTNPGWLESFVYSDGSGTVIMTKAPAAPGIAAQWNSATQSVDQVFANPRWIGNGRTILNNKGNPVKQYEPYFSATSGYETESALVETGATAILYYDPLDRNIRSDFPDGTFAKVEFDGWMSKSYDGNDTVLDSAWYVAMGSPNPAGPEPSDPNQRSAWLAAKAYNTPAVAHSDGLGQSFYSVADYGGGVTASIYSLSDFTGRYANGYDQLSRNVAQAYTNLLGHNMYSVVAEKGERWTFTDVLGRLVGMWDNDICIYTNSYDALSRPVSNYLIQGGTQTVLAHFVYGDILPRATAQSLNITGRVYQVYDQAGRVTIDTIDFKGNTLQSSRNLCLNYQNQVDWTVVDSLTDITAINAAAAPLLDAETFTNTLSVDALNRSVTIDLPDGSVLTPTYDPGGTMMTLSGNIMGAAASTLFLAGQTYNAKGQRLSARYGNNTVTNYAYDPMTLRVTNITTLQHPADPASQSLQDLNYYYDPVGNVTQLQDAAQQTHFFRNAVVSPVNRFVYDALYQLVSATGREHAGLGMDTQRTSTDIPALSPIPEVNDAGAVRNYTENYTYDLCGNILGLQHVATGASWTQRYQYQYQVSPSDATNRLSAISQPGDGPGVFSGTFSYTGGQDGGLHGNMTAMPGLPAGSLTYTLFDQLSVANLGGGGNAYYAYGAGAGRMRKVIQRIGGQTQERIYLGPVEIYRERQGDGTLTFERYTLHIADNMGRFAQVDTKTLDTSGSDTINTLGTPNIRYQYSNHLGSAMLETDSGGAVISYEEYHPFGTSSYRVTQTGYDISLKRYRYCGKERDDETGFFYSGARYYAAWLGRWITNDPGGFVDGFNMWRYCRNNPVCLNDPNGTTPPPDNFQLGVSDDRHDDLSDRSPEAGARLQQDVESHSHEMGGSRYMFRGSVQWQGDHWLYTASSWQEVDAEGHTLDSGSIDSSGHAQSGGGGTAGGGQGAGNGSDMGAAAGAGAGAGGPGTRAVTQNPEGPTLAVPDNFDNEKIGAYRDRITSDRGVGIRSEPPGGGNRTDDIRARFNNLKRQYEASLPGGQRPNPTVNDIDHSVELQHIIRGTRGGADTVRAVDHRVQPLSLNRSQGKRGQLLDRAQINAGASENVPAGGVARVSQVNRFYNRPGFRTTMRGLGYGLMVAGPVLTFIGSSQVSNPGVRYGGYGLATVEGAAVAYYTYGRFALQGATGEAAGLAAMRVGSTIAMRAGGAAQFLLSGYFAVQEFRKGQYVAGGFDTAAALGGLALIAATVVASPALATGLVIAGVVTGVAAGIYHIGNAFHWW